MTKKPAPKKPATAKPTATARKKPHQPSVDDLMPELDAAIADDQDGSDRRR